MIEDPTQLLQVAVITGAVLLFFFGVWILIVRRRSSKSFEPGEALSEVAEARIDEGERISTLVSEQVEERVKEILKAEGSLLANDIDFATAADGSLEFWVNEKRYSSLDDIPDEAIRNAVRKAVEEFNR
jgi:hypothetical protein